MLVCFPKHKLSFSVATVFTESWTRNITAGKKITRGKFRGRDVCYGFMPFWEHCIPVTIYDIRLFLLVSVKRMQLDKKDHQHLRGPITAFTHLLHC